MCNARKAIWGGLPVLICLASYFLTTVLANLIYASPFGAELLTQIGYPTVALSFPESFTLGFFALLLLPIIVMPPVALLTQRALKPFQPQLLQIPEIGRPEF